MSLKSDIDEMLPQVHRTNHDRLVLHKILCNLYRIKGLLASEKFYPTDVNCLQMYGQIAFKDGCTESQILPIIKSIGFDLETNFYYMKKGYGKIAVQSDEDGKFFLNTFGALTECCKDHGNATGKLVRVNMELSRTTREEPKETVHQRLVDIATNAADEKYNDSFYRIDGRWLVVGFDKYEIIGDNLAAVINRIGNRWNAK